MYRQTFFFLVFFFLKPILSLIFIDTKACATTTTTTSSSSINFNCQSNRTILVFAGRGTCSSDGGSVPAVTPNNPLVTADSSTAPNNTDSAAIVPTTLRPPDGVVGQPTGPQCSISNRWYYRQFMGPLFEPSWNHWRQPNSIYNHNNKIDLLAKEQTWVAK